MTDLDIMGAFTYNRCVILSELAHSIEEETGKWYLCY